jgi:hypothetical protein
MDRAWNEHDGRSLAKLATRPGRNPADSGRAALLAHASPSGKTL